jgi:hypothetical protein
MTSLLQTLYTAIYRTRRPSDDQMYEAAKKELECPHLLRPLEGPD